MRLLQMQMGNEKVITTHSRCEQVNFQKAIKEVRRFAGNPKVVACYYVDGDPRRSHCVAAFEVIGGPKLVCANS